MSSSPRFRPSGRHLALVGPTASGKSSLAMALARSRTDIELVTVDSMQIYRGMDIGTAKPTAADQSEIVHHLLDMCDPDDDYTVARFQRDCFAVLEDIEERGKRAVLVGGTGLYLQAITDDLEIPARFPEVRAELEIEPDTAVLFARGLEEYPVAPFPVVGLAMERNLLDQRIAQRYEKQMAEGFLAEVQTLLDCPTGLGRTARQALGYAELLDHIENGTPLDDALETAVTRTRRFARRQQRWFGRDPRINWIPADGEVSANALAELARGLID